MTGWLEGNLVGKVLAGVVGGLVVISLLLGVIWSLPPRAGEEGAEGDDDRMMLEVPQLAENAPIEQYAVITERPVFNESRMPELELDTGLEEAPLEEVEVDAPEVELAGVVITPTLRMVTLRQKNEKGESLVAFEGQPLRGDYGSWHVSRIEPREITLSSGDGDDLDLKLQVHDAKIEPPPKPEPKAAPQAAEQEGERQGGGDGEDAPMSRAEEIRQRIQERREELRRAAEAEAEANADQAASYRNAIQSMMSGRKNQANENDDDQ